MLLHACTLRCLWRLAVDLLRRVLRSAEAGKGAAGAPPQGVIASLAAAADAQARGLLSRGPWVNAQQLPRTFIRGLASRPWHSWDPQQAGSYPHIQPVVALLESATADLATEYADLKARGLLHPETECISDASSTPPWKTYSVNAAWVDRNASSDCSFDTPVACALLGSIAAAMRAAAPPFHVLRAGYSALAPAAHLNPHCGMTNGQLKLHLGLVVPMVGKGDARRPCAGEKGAQAADHAWAPT